MTRDEVAAVVGAVAVDGWVQLSGGASRATFAFDAVGADGGRRPMVLQERRAGAVATADDEAVDEAPLLRAAAGAGVPVPAVVAAGDGWLVTERVAGETIAPRILRQDRFAAARARLVGQCAAALAAVHRLPVALVPDTGDELDRWRALAGELAHPSPAFELAFRWLAANRPPPRGRVVVHGDFRLGNLVVGDDGLQAVLDWELAHAGDPLEDLGWLCVRAWRFGAGPPVAGVGEVGELLAAYGAAAGTVVDAAELRWWRVLGTVKWGLMCLVQAAAHLDGVARSVELAAIGRRVHENEHDVLALLP